ncbi:OmpA family protein [Chryseolinea lacunae]|uniref:OmpA family protein n=1 Tax=Chryseolinea lacunae TaxID=2801331 RepID=A0ABS1L0C5_9BACT|nr:OmpA family protein [Chryseolinea lacunae]MBL0745156.1 OmpA family protein [Chryseolinea lacunae]
MKNLTRLALLFGLLCISGQVFSQESNELSPGYYVVANAYAKTRENVAQNYVDVLKLKGIEASYGYNASRGLFFVYLKYFDNLKESLKYMKSVRSQEEFKNAWVRVVPGDIVPATASSAVPETRTTPVRPTNRQPTPQPVPATKAPEGEAPKPDTTQTTADIIDNPEILQHEVMTLGNTEVFLSLYNARNNRIVAGDVQVIDTDRSRLITRVKGNEYLILPDPKSKSGQLTLVCDAFGYRKIQQEINYPLPLADTVKEYIDLMGTTLVINFDLVRYHRGDISTLYNVYFFNDAALMLPESTYELNSLLAMMEENPKYRIRLHGHTNGNYHGKIISVGPEKKFFTLDGSVQGVGSAKDLSFKRAEVIKQYLESKGIEASRMEIKAWGGKRPVYDKSSVNAKKNVRVEVEILDE